MKVIEWLIDFLDFLVSGLAEAFLEGKGLNKIICLVSQAPRIGCFLNSIWGDENPSPPCRPWVSFRRSIKEKDISSQVYHSSIKFGFFYP